MECRQARVTLLLSPRPDPTWSRTARKNRCDACACLYNSLQLHVAKPLDYPALPACNSLQAT